MWEQVKRAAVANVTTKAPAAALGWGGRSTGGWGGTAGTPRDALRSAVEIATALARRLSVPQCSAGHVRPAAGEMGARCSRECWPRKAVGYRSSALHRAARHLQRAHCARALARNDKAPGTRSEAAARCGDPGTGVPRTRPGRGRAAPLLARRRQAHRGSGASLPFATTGHVPREELCARQRRARQRRTSPPTGGAAHCGMPRHILLFPQHSSKRPRGRLDFSHMTEPHHALTVDGEGEDSGGNEVHEY